MMAVTVKPTPIQSARMTEVDDVRNALRLNLERLAHNWITIYRLQTKDREIYWLHGQEPEQASCEVDADYDLIKLYFNLDRIFSEVAPTEQSELVCHEVAHVTTWPLWELCDDLIGRLREENVSDAELAKWEKDLRRAGERSTTRVHRAVFNAYRINRK